MKLYDFDEKFMDYCREWVALHPGLNPQQIEDHYNEMMLGWLNAPASWLGGQTPGTYFNRYSEPKDLMKLLEEYDKRDMGLPEPLFNRIVTLGETCAQSLTAIVSNVDKPETLRATAIALLRDIGSQAPHKLYVDLVCACKQPNELSEMASDILAGAGGDIVDELMERYDDASDYAQTLILDICSNYPGDERAVRRCIDKLRMNPDNRAYFASLLEKMGDDSALPVLQQALQLTELSYLGYIELRNAVESLGGDPGEERTFYGDPDYEAMRNM